MKTFSGVVFCLFVLSASGQTSDGAREWLMAQTASQAGLGELPGLKLRLFEFEMAGGVNLPRRLGDWSARPGANFLAELRFNRPEPFDFGLQLGGSVFSHSRGDYLVRSSVFAPALFVDYNWRESGRRTAFFAGLGVGGNFAGSSSAVLLTPSSGLYFASSRSSLAITPRFGATLFRGLRLTAFYTFTHRDYSRAGFNVGITFGGSYRRPGTKGDTKVSFWEDIFPIIFDWFVPYNR